MSRAFIKENDGWQLCKEKREHCLFADENGRCIVDPCRIYGGTSNQETAEKEHK